MTDFTAFAMHLQMTHAAAFLQVDQAKCAQVNAAQAVPQQGGQHCVITQARRRGSIRRRP